MKTMTASLGLLAMLAFVDVALACHTNPRCAFGTSEYSCDRCLTPDGNDTCTSTSNDHCGSFRCVNNPSTFCDDNNDCPAGDHCDVDGADGIFVLCGTTNVDNTNDTLNGGSGVDVICGFGGNDTIDGKGGDDELVGGDGTDTIIGGNGHDGIYAYGPAGGGDDFIDGGPGDDGILGTSSVSGSGGDNVVLAGDGADTVITGDGRDVVKGGPGNDLISTIYYGAPTFPDDVVGTLFCGEGGNDQLVAWGPSHQCMDGGDGTDTCSYSFYSSGTDTAEDLGTGRNCETGGTAGAPSCGCESN